MRESDFIHYGIENFTADEVRRTGAALVDVNPFTMRALQAFRTHKLVDRTVILLHNGITTGEHKSWQHPNGTAVDVCFRDVGSPVVPKQLVYAAEDVGFRGIGLYYNGAAISMHLDLGPDIRRWCGVKPHRSQRRTMLDLILDPIQLKEKGAIEWPE
jgi:hypothetical protein